jgi:sulfopyruvate decarboxylase TPP-binding subunit
METLRALMAERVTHVVGLPDNTTGPLFDLLAGHATVKLVTVTREGEAFAVASGLWLGGASPLVAIQNTGLLEAGDSLRGTALRMAAPVPIVVTARGYAKMSRAGLSPDAPRSMDVLTRADVDSVALLTEPTLEAWGVPFRRCEAGADPVAAIVETIRAARRDERPTAVVMARALA